MTFFDKLMTIRLRADEYREIQLKCRNHRNIYYNTSHFIRVAIMREIHRK